MLDGRIVQQIKTVNRWGDTEEGLRVNLDFDYTGITGTIISVDVISYAGFTSSTFVTGMFKRSGNSPQVETTPIGITVVNSQSQKVRIAYKIAYI